MENKLNFKPAFKLAFKAHNQAEANILIEIAENIGYPISDRGWNSMCCYVTNNWNIHTNSEIGIGDKNCSVKYGRNIIEEWTPEMAKALLLASEGDNWNVGEMTYRINKNWDNFKVGDIYQVEDPNYSNTDMMFVNHLRAATKTNFRKPTFGEIVNHFKQNTNNTNTEKPTDMKKYTIEQLKKAYIAVKCTSPAQGRQVAKYLFGDSHSLASPYFNFNNYEVFYIYSDKNGSSGWGRYINEREPKAWGVKEIIDFNQVVFPEPIGYKLIKEYPGSPDLNSFFKVEEDYCKKFCLEYPEYWEPIYQEEKKEVVIKDLGTNKVSITLVKGQNYIVSPLNKSERIDITKLEAMHDNLMQISSNLGDYPAEIAYDAQCIRIGCKSANNLFSLEEIANVLQKYKELNN